MKKTLIIAVFAALCSTLAYAQPRSIGANLGSGIGFSYQHGFGESNMLDVAANVPIIFGGIGGHVTYDWINPFGASFDNVWDGKGEWNWFMGVGGAGGVYGWDFAHWYAGAAGHVGVEYNFWFPLQLSVDWRPCIGVDNWNDKVGFGLGGLYGVSLGVRYKF